MTIIQSENASIKITEYNSYFLCYIQPLQRLNIILFYLIYLIYMKQEYQITDG